MIHTVTSPLDGLNGLVIALPALVAIACCAPGLLRDAHNHLTRKDLPK